jgi:hypothetical protein
MKKYLLKLATICAVLLLSIIVFVSPLYAFETSKLGVHILRTEEVFGASELLQSEADEWHYVTIPLTWEDTENFERWQTFFDLCKKEKIIPIVRLTTQFDPKTGAWKVPNRRHIVDQISFLSHLQWPSEKRYIIVFNEVNHAKEWGGKIDPEGYSKILRFTADWAHTEEKKYIVLPAGLDLAAPNGYQTRDSFLYLSQMVEFDKDIFEVVDVWNSHSYPNPGFSSSPTRFARNSLRGYQFELNYLKSLTGRDFKVMITETGWDSNPWLSKWLSSYYAYAMQHIWSDEKVIAVTPFVLQGSPGPFSGFSFLDEKGQPTQQYFAFQSAVEKVTNLDETSKVGLKK